LPTFLVYAVLTLGLAFAIKLTLLYYWFDQLEEVLQWLSKLCPDCPEAIQLSDWSALRGLTPRSRPKADVQILIYPNASR
jgi:hypothetical protein